MADTVTSQTIQDGEKKAILKFTNISDGTGESAVTKVDVTWKTVLLHTCRYQQVIFFVGRCKGSLISFHLIFSYT